ncbi:MAG TPA: WYL domain-containing protein [Mycobacteriales bacterium]|nr:WYL domain-containing protein [Mycobacteriales bacterium]
MRADRLLQLLLLLQTYERATAGELATRLGVSTRTVQRDLETLSLAGVPIYPVRGHGGGWSLLPGYRTSLTGMTPAEAITVFIGSTAHVLADLGFDLARDRAQTKLLAALPTPVRHDAEFARQRVFIDHPGWRAESVESPQWLDACRQAVWEQKQITIRYGGRDGTTVLEPLGLVVKGRAWYVVGRRSDREMRTYRIARIDDVEVSEQEFERPPDFDLQAYWAEATRRFRANLPSYIATLEMKNELIERLPYGPPLATAPVKAGWSRIDADFEVLDAAITFVLGAAGDAIAIAPAELQREIHRAAARVIRRHDP